MAVLPTLDNMRRLLQRVIFVPIVYGFISLLPMFLTGWENSDRLADRLFATIRSKENMFDFIIVGGGTAGALVANRLAEHYKVLLLEAGGTPSPFQTIPALALKFLNHPQTDWSHKTVPQRKACLNSINQQSSWSSGRGLGGTTNINFMTHVRGHPMDYENWAEITGDPTWGYQGVLPYFKRCETFSGTSNDPEAHGHDGELRIRKPSYIGLSEDWIRAGQEIGYPFVDLNGRHEEGFGILQYPIYKGIRQSTYAAFLLPMHKSPRLTIRRYALVRKVLFRDMHNMAYGVEYVRHGKIETAIATKEVILSAGTLGSSKLLMLSGVGPREHLEELGIPVRSNLPVGTNLQDHLGVHLGPFFISEPKSFLFDRDVTPENIVRWLFLGTGPITTTGYQGAASLVSSIAKSQGQGNWPDLHLILHGQAIHQGYMDAFSYAYSLQEDELMQYYTNAIGRDSFHIYVVGARPTSTGQVLLSGASISDPLVINPRYMQDGANRDFKILLEGVKTALNIANTTMFQRLGTEFTKAKLPGCQDLELASDEYWECYIRRFTLTMHNPVGTVALGAVVDPALRVRGTRGLRVVDASIQPTLVSTGTAASTLMIAEKGVDLILKDHGIPDRDQDLFDVIFGRNGFFKKNPILKILQREFDTLNPLRALFKPFITVASAAEQNTESSVAKERFTRNGKLDNPFLQIFSSVFGGNSNYFNKADNSVAAAATNNIAVSQHRHVEGEGYGEEGENKMPFNYSGSVTRRSTAEEEEEEKKKNVISKNAWVLQQPSSSSSSKSVNFTLKLKPIQHTTGLKITEVKKRGKGGKRYALLQAILKKEAEMNATGTKMPTPTWTLSLATTAKTTTTTTPLPPPPPPPATTTSTSTTSVLPTTTATLSTTAVKSTVKPVVQVVQFQRPAVKNANTSENEISEEEHLTSHSPPANGSNEPTVFGNIVAKPISLHNPSSIGLLPVHRLPQQTFAPTPLQQLFKSLSSFEQFMTSLTAKDRLPPLTFPPLPPLTTTPSPPGAGFFSVAQSQNIFHSPNNNGNIFDFLSTSNKNAQSKSSSSTTTTTGPFHFLFGITNKSASTPIPPLFQNVSAAEDLANAVGVVSATAAENDERSSGNITTRSQPQSAPAAATLTNNFFSSWFNPPPPLQTQSTNSWFKPLNKSNLLQKPSSSWFKPLNDLSSSPKDKSSASWFKPFNLDNNDKSSSSWFKPINFNAPQNSKLSSPPQMSNKDVFSDLFELFFGGLKKHERRAVFKTLNTMLDAGETLADIIGAPGGTGSTSTRSAPNFFEQISKGRKRDTGEKDEEDKKKEQLLKSLIALNQVLGMHNRNATVKPVVKSTVDSSSSNNNNSNSLEEFLSTFDYPPLPPMVERTTTTEQVEATTMMTTPEEDEEDSPTTQAPIINNHNQQPTE